MTSHNHGTALGYPTPDDERLDALTLRLGGDYNKPPDIVPVERMWSNIQREHTAMPVPPTIAARGSRSVAGWQLLAASVVLLAAGVAVGRQLTVSPTGAGASRTVTIPRSGRSGSSGPAAFPGAPTAPMSGATGNAEVTASASSPVRVRHAVTQPDGHSQLRGDEPGDGGGTAAAAGLPSAGRHADLTYRLAVLHHFTDAEALLTAYAAGQRDARSDAQLAAWARSLLSQTRLLLDSPAARDPVRHRLLEDLELVLVDMAGLSDSAPQVERDMLDGTVRQGDMMNRLRSAIPAGGSVNSSGV